MWASGRGRADFEKDKTEMTPLAKEQTAVQILAMTQASLEQPSVEDVIDILERAKEYAASSAPPRGGDDGQQGR